MQLDFAFQVASAMSFLHSRNVIHCNFKANNILLADKDGKPFCRLGDFGISGLSFVTTYTATTSTTFNHARGTIYGSRGL